MTVPVVLDVDGTICFDGRTIADDVVAALAGLKRRAWLVFASARPVRDLLPVLPERFHDDTLIGGNGAFCRHRGESTVLGIDDDSRRLLDELIARHRLRFHIDGDWDYAFTGEETHQIFRQLDVGRLAANLPSSDLVRYAKVVLFTEDPAVIEEVRRLPLVVHVHADAGFVDLSPGGVTKHHALNRLGIEDGTYVAFGNDVNDELMLRRARVSHRVGPHPALAFADRHVATSEVAEAIRSLEL